MVVKLSYLSVQKSWGRVKMVVYYLLLLVLMPVLSRAGPFWWGAKQPGAGNIERLHPYIHGLFGYGGSDANGGSGSCLKRTIHYEQGEVTAYTGATGGHCGFTGLPSGVGQNYVAISQQDAEGWLDGHYCGACVRLQYTDGKVDKFCNLCRS